MTPPRNAAAGLPPSVFVDTSYVLALIAHYDEHHAEAEALATALELARTRFVTTHAVLFEIGDALARPRHRAAAIRVLQSIESDVITDVVPVTALRYARARELYTSRRDQDWGLTDCVSFVVMREFGLTHALTADRHFAQAGFRALLRPS